MVSTEWRLFKCRSFLWLSRLDITYTLGSASFLKHVIQRQRVPAKVFNLDSFVLGILRFVSALTGVYLMHQVLVFFTDGSSPTQFVQITLEQYPSSSPLLVEHVGIAWVTFLQSLNDGHQYLAPCTHNRIILIPSIKRENLLN